MILFGDEKKAFEEGRDSHLVDVLVTEGLPEMDLEELNRHLAPCPYEEGSAKYAAWNAGSIELTEETAADILNK